MKRFWTLALLFCLFVNGLLAQKKEIEETIQPAFSVMFGYAAIKSRTIIPLSLEYQLRHKNFAIAVGLNTEYQTYHSGLGFQYRIGDTIDFYNPSVPTVYKSTEHWLNILPSLLGYYYLGKKGKLEGFFKAGIVANYVAWYSREALEYKIDNTGKILDTKYTPVSQTTNSIDLQSINWLIGGGILYNFNKKTALRASSEMQWGRGVVVLGGVLFKI